MLRVHSSLNVRPSEKKNCSVAVAHLFTLGTGIVGCPRPWSMAGRVSSVLANASIQASDPMCPPPPPCGNGYGCFVIFDVHCEKHIRIHQPSSFVYILEILLHEWTSDEEEQELPSPRFIWDHRHIACVQSPPLTLRGFTYQPHPPKKLALMASPPPFPGPLECFFVFCNDTMLVRPPLHVLEETQL